MFQLSINPMARIQCIKTFEIFHALFVLEELEKHLSLEVCAFDSSCNLRCHGNTCVLSAINIILFF